jgi:hypothetical protein
MSDFSEDDVRLTRIKFLSEMRIEDQDLLRVDHLFRIHIVHNKNILHHFQRS